MGDFYYKNYKKLLKGSHGGSNPDRRNQFNSRELQIIRDAQLLMTSHQTKEDIIRKGQLLMTNRNINRQISQQQAHNMIRNARLLMTNKNIQGQIIGIADRLIRERDESKPERPKHKSNNRIVTRRNVRFSDRVAISETYSKQDYPRGSTPYDKKEGNQILTSIIKDIQHNGIFSENIRKDYRQRYFNRYGRYPDPEKWPSTPLSYTYPHGNCSNMSCEDREGNCWMYLGKKDDQHLLAKQANIPRRNN